MQVGDLVRCTGGSGSGTVGIIVALSTHGGHPLATLNNGEYYSVARLEVLSGASN